MLEVSHSGELEGDIQQEAISVIVKFCLRYLVKMGRVSESQIRGRVTIDWGSSKELKGHGLAAAASQDSENRAVLKLDTTLPFAELVWAIPHEAVHVAQICRGDLLLPPGEGTYWKGTRYTTLGASDPA